MKPGNMISTGIGVLALAIGIFAMLALLYFSKPPAEAKADRDEKAILVEVLDAQPENVPVTITGYGEVRVLKVLDIAPKVSGAVIEVHPNLLPGGIVPEGEMLFRIDAVPYEARVAEMRAQVAQAENGLKRLRTEATHLDQRLASLKRALTLAQKEYERTQQLLDEGIGSHTEQERAEQALVAADLGHGQAAEGLALLPVRTAEIEQELSSARARLDVALHDLEATRPTAPFRARVKSTNIEAGQFASAGVTALSLADDSILEISVPLDGRTARRWIQFEKVADDGKAPGFSGLVPRNCRIGWTEDADGVAWEGTLHRVEAFDPKTRTLTVVVRIEGAQALAQGPDQFPLAEGMFCSVEIPGRGMEGVFALPQHAVSFENTVYVAKDERLNTAPIEVARIQHGMVYVSGGLEQGDQVIVTRLVNPLDNSLLKIVAEGGDAAP